MFYDVFPEWDSFIKVYVSRTESCLAVQKIHIRIRSWHAIPFLIIDCLHVLMQNVFVSKMGKMLVKLQMEVAFS